MIERADIACVMEHLGKIEGAAAPDSVTLIDHGPERSLEIVLGIATGQRVERNGLEDAEHRIAQTLRERASYPNGGRIAQVRIRHAKPNGVPRPTIGAEQWSGQQCMEIARDLRGEGAGDTGHPPWPQARHYEVSIRGQRGRNIARRLRWADHARAAAMGIDPERIETAREALRSPDKNQRGPVTVIAVRREQPTERYWRVYPGRW